MRGLKYSFFSPPSSINEVALYTSAWIEIPKAPRLVNAAYVALYTNAWIEIYISEPVSQGFYVALYTSAWIEMANTQDAECYDPSRTLHECVD